MKGKCMYSMYCTGYESCTCLLLIHGYFRAGLVMFLKFIFLGCGSEEEMEDSDEEKCMVSFIMTD